MNTSEDNLKRIRSMVESRASKLMPEKIDCAKGCSYCCQCFPVSIHSLEEARLALMAAKKTYTSRAFRTLTREIRRQFGLTRYVGSVTEFNRLKLACPFLVNDACSIYTARPISCRTCISNDKIVCMSALGPSGCVLTADAEMQQYLGAIQQYREMLYRDEHFGDCMLEFRAALVYVLENHTPGPGNFPIDPLHAATPAGKTALGES